MLSVHHVRIEVEAEEITEVVETIEEETTEVEITAEETIEVEIN
jgi:hypothetical protein